PPAAGAPARALVGGHVLPARPRAVRPRPRRRSRPDQAVQLIARAARGGGRHGGAPRPLRGVGGPREPAPAARCAGRRAAGTAAASANRIRMTSVLVPPPGVLDGELREPLLRFVQAAFALAARELANGSEVSFVLDAHESGESALYSYRPLYGAFLDERRS